ncbi:MAG: isochorismatase family protein [Pseudomonadota bacterium]
MVPEAPDARPSGARHETALPPWAIAKMTRRRGRRHAFDPLEPRRTALVVIDMTAETIANTPCAAATLAPISRLAAALRAAGGLVAWILPGPFAEGAPKRVVEALWGADRLAALETAGRAAKLAPDLTPGPDDLILRKEGYSAFFPGACDLPERLAARGIDRVLITGALTNVCCESSARDAAARGFGVTMVADANAARSDEEHRATLYTILRNFGDVRASTELLAALCAADGPGADHQDHA